MRDYNEILSNTKLNILTQNIIGDSTHLTVQIRATYSDPLTRKQYWCKFTKAEGWEHLTVSGKNKVPDWDVMCSVKEIFWEDEECCIQYHPRKSEYVNNNEHCLHIWRPDYIDIPEPPSLLVGIKGMSSQDTQEVCSSFINSLPLEEQIELAASIGIKLNRTIRKAIKK